MALVLIRSQDLLPDPSPPGPLLLGGGVFPTSMAAVWVFSWKPYLLPLGVGPQDSYPLCGSLQPLL